jgi:hypothetical protein
MQPRLRLGVLHRLHEGHVGGSEGAGGKGRAREAANGERKGARMGEASDKEGGVRVRAGL